MGSNINESQRRFEEIIKGRIRKDLKDFIKSDYIFGKKGKDKITIPLPHIDIPKFKFGKDEDGEGMGEGDGDIGDPVAPGDDEGEGIERKAGEQEGEHTVEVDVTLEELAQILGEELELPRIEPKGKKRIYTEFEKYHGLRKVGPDALLRFRPTYLAALKRMIASGEYDYDNPVIMITKDDMRFRSWKTHTKPESDAAIIYMMDVSGSMSDRHKSIARKISFWTDLWIRAHYRGVESVYVIHDYNAQEVDQHTFYHTTTSGGTRIWSGYDLVNRIIDLRYNPEEWNIYFFQYSDGENWGNNTDEFKLLYKEILPKINLMCYGQIDIPWWIDGPYSDYFSDVDIEGPYKEELEEFIDKTKYSEKVVTHSVKHEDDILEAIRAFLSTGK